MKLNLVSAILLCSISVCGNAQKLTDYVDPTIGTGDHGHVFIGANVPFGMVQAGPNQVQSGWDWCSGYHESSDSIIGFSQLHLSGTGCADLGDVSILPINGPVECSRNGLVRLYTHDTEEAKAGYYAVTLKDPKSSGKDIRCEMTATKRVGMYRFSNTASIVIDLENTVSTWDKTTECRFEVLNDNTIVGFRNSTGWANNQQLAYAMTFSRPIKSVKYKNGVRPSAKGMQYAIVDFNGNASEPLLVKVALSPTSEANALANMKDEVPGWDFDIVRKSADEAWEKELGRVRATFPTEKESRIFYTAMFHFMVAPQLWCDANGDYMGADGRIHRNADYNHLTTWSLWDTYRSAHPLATLILRDRSRDYAHTMLDIFNQSGELPMWHLMSCETYCMVGEPGVPVLADLIMKGQVKDIPEETLYRTLTASILPTCTELARPEGYVLPHGYSFRGKDQLFEYGYVPFDRGHDETVARNMEYYIALWSAAQVAGKLGHKADSVKLFDLSMNYKKLYDKRVGFMRALDTKGKFRTTEGFIPGHQTKDYTEGNPWHYTFLVPHDVKGLVELIGGNDAFEKKLDDLLSADQDLGADANPDITGLIGQYCHGNEPSHHVLYMYNYVGRPHKTQKLVRKVMDELYDDKPAGLCGNEDVGQMSAWYILSALGLYQVEPCGGIYQLGCPIVKEARFTVDGGKSFIIRTKGNTTKGKVKRFMLNGKKLDRTYITYNEIMAGGELLAEF